MIPHPPLPPLRPRGDGGGAGGPRRLPPHRREPLGDGRRSTASPRRPASARPGSTSRRSRRCPAAPIPAAELERARRRRSNRRRAGRPRPRPARRRGGRPRLRGAAGPRVIFVGKLIVSKGCDLLLAAWPLVARRHPGARLLMVGFGEYRDGARCGSGAGPRRRRPRRRPRGRPPRLGARGRRGSPAAPASAAFLADPPAGYADAARAAAGTIDLAGRLEYGEVAEAVRASDAMVVPSTFPEAFGMVAAEAAAARRAAGLRRPLGARRGRRRPRRRTFPASSAT